MDRTDYDETPQRDSDHPGYKFIFENRGTSVASNVISDEQQIDFKKITNLPALPTTTSHSGYYSSGKRKISNSESSDMKEIPKQDLLLGDEYKLSPADTAYDSCLPYPLNLFYPTIATQTISSDFIAAEQLWAKKAPKKAPETGEIVWRVTKTITDENKRKPARVADESEKSSDDSSRGSPTRLFVDKHQPKPKSVLVPPRVIDEVTKNEISSENSSRESSTKIFIHKYQSEIVPERFSDEANEQINKSPKGSPTKIIPSKVVEEKRTSETSTTDTSPKATTEPSKVAEDLTSIGASDEVKNVNLKPGSTDNESAFSAVSTINSAEADPVTAPQSVGIHFERKTEAPAKEPVKGPAVSTLKKVSKEGETTGSEASFVNYTFISANNIHANYDGGANEPSTESVISVTKSDDSAFTALCKKLDAKHSSSPTNSQLVYIQEVVNELDK